MAKIRAMGEEEGMKDGPHGNRSLLLLDGRADGNEILKESSHV